MNAFINVAFDQFSVLGLIPMPYGALYAATKHAIEGYSESLDHELRNVVARSCVS
jgi:short-subunit dehydrogenase